MPNLNHDVVEELEAEIERLQAWKDRHYRTEGGDCPHCEIDRLSDEIERLRDLTENDAKEIGSYREGTGLRGENQRLREQLSFMTKECQRFEAALERITKDAPFSRYRAWEYQTIAREALKDE